MTGRRTAIDTLGPLQAKAQVRRRPAVTLVLAGALALGLAACARSGPPAPVVYGSGGPGERQAGQTQTAQNETGDRQVDRSGRSSAPSAPRRREGQPDTVRDRGSGADRATSTSNRDPERRAQPTQRTSVDVNWARTGRAGIHTVAKGDSVYGLARRYQVPIRAIIDANDLTPPYTLYVGQEIRIPVPRRHVVARGDTVYGISRAYGVDMSELTRLNDIQPPYEIAPGQVLVIPGRGQEAATRTAGRTDGAPENTDGGASAAEQPQTTDDARATDAASGRSRTARRDSDGSAGGGSGSSDAGDSDAAQVASLPSAPAGTPTPPRAPARKTASEPGSSAETNQRTQTNQRQASAKPAAAPQPKSIPQPPPRANSRFLWPVQGKVLSSFGPMEGGLHNDGINIAAPEGTPVKAAENGVVAYVGNELRGFGNLLLIKHADGWVTAYAHTQEILVRHGQQVKRGQIVARVGATGSVGEPQLHFEVRKGSKAKDPAQLLGSQQAAR
jgi:murein DD-endopeptidase MepM/ murein hydrolase activator NlpD